MRRFIPVSAFAVLGVVALTWLARSALPGGNGEAGGPGRLLTESILRSLERPGVSPWLDRVTTLLRDHPQMVKRLLDRGDGIDRAGLGEYAAFRLTFPQFANGGAGGVSLRSSLVLINNGGATATGTIHLRQDGWVMNVPTTLGFGNRFSFSLAAGQTFRLDTEGSGPLSVGWAEVQSDIPLSGSVRFTTFDGAGRFVSEVGIGDSVRSTQLMIVVDTTNGKDSGFAVCNPSNESTADLTLDLRRLDGTLIASTTKVLFPHFQTAEFVTQTFPGATAKDFQGVLVVRSDSVPVSVVTLRTQGLNYTSLPAVPEATPTDSAEDLLFARIGDGIFGTLKLQTTFFLQNNSASPVRATLDLYAQDGAPLPFKIGTTRSAEFEVTVPAGGALILQSDGSTNPGGVGWARVSSDRRLGGGAAFTVTTRAGGALQAEVGVPASPSTPMPAIYVDEQGVSSTALALTNPVDEAVTIRLKLTGQAGTSESQIHVEKRIALDPHQHVALYVPELFPDIPAVKGHDFTGCLEVESWNTEMGEDFLSDLASLTLLSHGTYLTSAPVAEHKVNFGPRATLRPATLLAGATPAFRVDLRQLAGEIPMDTARITLNKGTIDLTGVARGTNFGQAMGRIQVFFLRGELYVSDVNTQRTWADFYTPFTLDGVRDYEPFWARLTNQYGGGIKLEIFGDRRGGPQVEATSANLFDLLPKLLRLPNEPDTVISVTEEYDSEPFTPSDGSEYSIVLQCRRSQTITLGSVPSGAPRVNAVMPSTVVGGGQITIEGANFAASTAGNTVTVEGESRLTATVLEATDTRLVVQLPEAVRTGNLRVMAGGLDSNDYLLQVLFAPVPKLTASSYLPSASTTLRIEIGQRTGEIAFDEIDLDTAEGGWITSGTGLSPGTIIGAAGYGNPGKYDLRVASSDSEKLLVDVIEGGKTDPAFLITFCKSCSPGFQLKSTGGPYSHLVPQLAAFVVDFAAPVFKNPAGSGQTVAFDTSLYSLPQRTLIPETRLVVERQLSYRTQ